VSGFCWKVGEYPTLARVLVLVLVFWDELSGAKKRWDFPEQHDRDDFISIG
jgi:hypothetical protein